MRFGAMLWLQKDAKIGQMRLYPKKRILELTLSQDAIPLFGEVAEARFNSLAAALPATPNIVLGQYLKGQSDHQN